MSIYDVDLNDEQATQFDARYYNQPATNQKLKVVSSTDATKDTAKPARKFIFQCVEGPHAGLCAAQTYYYHQAAKWRVRHLYIACKQYVIGEDKIKHIKPGTQPEDCHGKIITADIDIQQSENGNKYTEVHNERETE